MGTESRGYVESIYGEAISCNGLDDYTKFCEGDLNMLSPFAQKEERYHLKQVAAMYAIMGESRSPNPNIESMIKIAENSELNPRSFSQRIALA